MYFFIFGILRLVNKKKNVMPFSFFVTLLTFMVKNINGAHIYCLDPKTATKKYCPCDEGTPAM